jgi:hypothetical protein
MSLAGPNFRKQSRKNRRNSKVRKGASFLWAELNRPMELKTHSWWIPKVPSVVQMLWRCLALFILTAGIWAVEIVLILGENVLWTFKFVDLLYSNIGTNTFDVFTFVSITTWFLIWGPMAIIWVLGYWDRWMDS